MIRKTDGLKHKLPQIETARGAALARLGRYEEALAAARKAVDLKPNSKDAAGAYLVFSFVFKKFGREVEAMMNFNRALELNPKLKITSLLKA